MTFWINGAYHSEKKQLDISDRGFLLADGLFETLLVRHGQPVFFAEHMARLRRSAEKMGIPLCYSDKELLEVVRKVAQENAATEDMASARITLTRGSGMRGIVPPPSEQVSPTLLVTVAPAASSDKPVLLMISEVTRNENSPSAGLKTLAYTNNIMARQEAMAKGAEDAILLNRRGSVACATAANIFMITSEGVIVTPPSSAGILPGITRQIILDICREKNFQFKELEIQPVQLHAGRLFLTNSLMGLQPAYLLGEEGMAVDHADIFLELQAQYVQKVAADCEKWQVL